MSESVGDCDAEPDADIELVPVGVLVSEADIELDPVGEAVDERLPVGESVIEGVPLGLELPD